MVCILQTACMSKDDMPTEVVDASTRDATAILSAMNQDVMENVPVWSREGHGHSKTETKDGNGKGDSETSAGEGSGSE
jgi:hypothetical protein